MKKLTYFDLTTCKYSILLCKKLATINTKKDRWMSERLFYVLKKIDKLKDQIKKEREE